MTKTIASIALLASASTAMAMPRPLPPGTPRPKISNVCLATHQVETDGSLYGSCDETNNNQSLGRPLLSNGCAQNQVKLTFEGESPIRACLPPGIVQL